MRGVFESTAGPAAVLLEAPAVTAMAPPFLLIMLFWFESPFRYLVFFVFVLVCALPCLFVVALSMLSVALYWPPCHFSFSLQL